MGKLIAGTVIVIGVVAFFAMRGDKAAAPAAPTQVEKNQAMNDDIAATAGDMKEFSMTSYYDEAGKWFSLKEISVKKGDKVRIRVTNTKGSHDFAIDEYGIKKMTPLNEETVIEFTADKVGEFTYYCSMPGHRAGGQWGLLKVTE
ncbi:MAG: cupredoxin domain-containing protein [Candidatus Moranbacteria bacterium]|nr:cupredoxin domain-containing protein [Candidatus Moranbacteria bacterium]